MPHGSEQQRPVALGQDQIAEGCRHLHGVARTGVGVQPGGDLARRVAVDPLHRDPPLRVPGSGGEAVLADLPGAVGQCDLDAHVLTRAERGRRGPVGVPQDEGHGVGRLLAALGDLHRPPDLALGDAGLLIEPGLHGNERVGHQPVHLVPGRGDLGGDRVAEDLDDRGEEVLVHRLVLLGGDAERRVLVRDAGEHEIRAAARVVEQGDREGGYGSRQRLPLIAVGLVPAVEQIAEQLGMGGEEPRVEALGDLVERAADGGQSGTDDRGGLRGQHGALDLVDDLRIKRCACAEEEPATVQGRGVE